MRVYISAYLPPTFVNGTVPSIPGSSISVAASERSSWADDSYPAAPILVSNSRTTQCTQLASTHYLPRPFLPSGPTQGYQTNEIRNCKPLWVSADSSSQFLSSDTGTMERSTNTLCIVLTHC